MTVSEISKIKKYNVILLDPDLEKERTRIFLDQLIESEESNYSSRAEHVKSRIEGQ